MSRLPIIDLPEKMPCVPCRWNSVCCSWGTELTPDEARKIAAVYGEDKIRMVMEDNEWRTVVIDGKCVFLKDNGCSIHETAEYPSTCRLFPWKSIRGGPYEYTLDICPALAAEPKP